SVEATRDVLSWQDGPTVLVAHSFGGMILTEAGVDPRVSAVVYVAARAPDAGEDYQALASKVPTPPASAGILWSKHYGRVNAEAFLRDLAGDGRAERARVLYAVQDPFKRSWLADRQPKPHGDPNRAGTRYRRKTERSTRICSASWPSVWAQKQSRSMRAT